MSNLSTVKIDKKKLNILAKNLKALIQARNSTEAEVALAVNLPILTVRRIVSGETVDPRISTLKAISDYFNISLDVLLNENDGTLLNSTKKIPQIVPKLRWDDLLRVTSITQIDFKTLEEWQPLTLNTEIKLSLNTFAIESKPSMRPRYPLGTVFIIDPEEKPIDNDVILIKMKHTGELSLRELIIDPPAWQLQPIVSGSQVIFFDSAQHAIFGVVMLSLFQTRK